MINVSTRAGIPLTIAIALLTIPIAHHQLNKPRSPWCEVPEVTLNDRILPNIATQMEAILVPRKHLGEASGTLALPGKWKTPPRFRITRTIRLDQYYFIPRRTFLNPYLRDTLENVTVDLEGAELPLHLREDTSLQLSRTTVYFYILGNRPAANPFFGGIALALPQFLRGSFPLTTIMVQGSSDFEEASINRATLIDWAARAWTEIDQTCTPRDYDATPDPL